MTARLLAADKVPVGFGQVVRNRNVALLLAASTVSTLGNWLSYIAAVSLATFRWEASAVQVAAITLAVFLPSALFSPLAGLVADRFNRRTLLIVADLARSAIILLMLVTQNVYQVCLVLVALKTVGTVYLPATGSIVPRIIPRGGIIVANAALAQPAQVTRFIGPAAAAMIIVAVGPRAAFVFDSVTFLVSAGLVARLVGDFAPTADSEASSGQLSRPHGLRRAADQLRQSLRIAFAVTGILLLLGLGAAGTMAFGAIEAIYPVYIREFVKSGSWLYAASVSAAGAGAILGAIAVSAWLRRRDRLEIVLGGLALAGTSVLLMVALPYPPAIMLFNVAMAGGGMAAVVAGQSYLQEECSADHLGRILGFQFGVTNGAMVAAMAAAGLAVPLAGVRAVFLAVGGTLALGTVVAAAKRAATKARSPIRHRPSWEGQKPSAGTEG